MRPKPTTNPFLDFFFAYIRAFFNPGIGVNDLKSPVCGKSVKPRKSRRKLTTFIGPRNR